MVQLLLHLLDCSQSVPLLDIVEQDMMMVLGLVFLPEQRVPRLGRNRPGQTRLLLAGRWTG